MEKNKLALMDAELKQRVKREAKQAGMYFTPFLNSLVEDGLKVRAHKITQYVIHTKKDK